MIKNLVKKILEVMPGEIYKKIAWYSIVLVLSFVVYCAYIVIVGVTPPAGSGAVDLALYIFEEMSRRFSLFYYDQTTLFVVANCVFVVAGSVFNIKVFGKLRKELEATRATLKASLEDGEKAQLAVKFMGLRGRWPNSHVGPDSAWESIESFIKRKDCSEIRILCATGSYTFGGADSPLYDHLRKFKGKIRIILASPISTATIARAKALNVSYEQYQDEIRNSQLYIKRLKDSGALVGSAYYMNVYNWKMVITNHAAFIQYYSPGGESISDTPALIVEPNIDHDTLYNMFSIEFERIWDRCERA